MATKKNLPAGIQGQDNPPPGFTPTVGATYVDTVTGETKQYMGANNPDRVVAPATTTTTRQSPTTTTPRQSPTTTTPRRPPTTTTTPRQSSTTTTPRRSPTTTTPPTTVAPTTTTPPTTVAPTSTTTPPDIFKKTPEELAAFFASLAGGTNEGTTGLPSSYTPPTRKWTDPTTGQIKTYTGNQLVNLTTGALSNMYKINIDPTAIIGTKLGESGPQGLLKFLKQLESLGFYQGGRVGNGTSDNDVSAVAGFLRYANMQGLEMNSALVVAQQQIPSNFRVGPGGAQVTSSDDLKAVFEAVAMSVLGRGISDAQLNSMVAAYQQQERSAAYGGEAAPQAQTYATNALRQKFKGEAQDFRAMNVADSMLNIIRSA